MSHVFSKLSLVILMSLCFCWNASADPSTHMITVKSLHFKGLHAITEEKLKEQLLLRPGEMQERVVPIDIDITVKFLKQFYANLGYVQAKITPPKLPTLSKVSSVDLTFNIVEGIRYKMGKVDFDGDLFFPKATLMKMTNIKDEKYFSYAIFKADLLALSVKYRSAKKPVKITWKPKMNKKTETLDLNIKIQAKKKTVPKKPIKK